jgi:hypothetical protein
MFTYDGKQFFVDAAKVWAYKGNSRIELSEREVIAARAAAQSGHGAMMYVWGRQDAGDGGRDSEVGMRFGEAYAAVIYRFKIGDHCSHGPVQDAYNKWIQDGSL